MRNPFRYFNSSPEVIRLAVMMYVRYPLSLRQVEDLLCVPKTLSALRSLLRVRLSFLFELGRGHCQSNWA